VAAGPRRAAGIAHLVAHEFAGEGEGGWRRGEAVRRDGVVQQRGVVPVSGSLYGGGAEVLPQIVYLDLRPDLGGESGAKGGLCLSVHCVVHNIQFNT
jgi:hypothetical protein